LRAKFGTQPIITSKRKKEEGNMKKLIFTATLGIAFLLLSGVVAAPLASAQLTNIELLGKYVFFDKISSPSRMACVTCHQPDTGGTGGVSGVNLHQVAITGANPHTVGNLKPPTNAYATFIETFKRCGRGGLGALNVCGGNFWNGRSEGNEFPPLFAGATKHIGDEIFYTTEGTYMPDYPLIYPDVLAYSNNFGPTADQALNPMPNPVEQNIDRQAVCRHVASAKYAPLYKLVWGVEIDCRDIPVEESAPDVAEEKAFDISFKRIMLAVCAWQASEDLNSFSSKRDIALRNDSDGRFPLDGFTAQENLGHDLFYNTKPVPFAPEVGFNLRPFLGLPITNCSFCHTSGPRIGVPAGLLGTDPLERYSDDAYHIIGTPRNPEIPETFNADGDPIDPDLGIRGHAGDSYPSGFFKVPTLRNVDKRKGEGFIKAYTHNGWFKSLESIVHFYNTSLIGGATANLFGVTRCPEGVEMEKDALANNCWPAPAYPGASPVLIGNLGLTSEQEAAIVAYLKTLTDTFTPKAPKPYK
jgi:cytochrome c peroxidase